MNKKLKLQELGRVDIDAYRAMTKRPICVVLDGLRSAHNVGAIFRTADALAIERLLLTGITPVPPHKDITKTAIGATLSVAYDYFDEIVVAVSHLKELGYTLIGLEQTTQSVPLTSFKWPKKTALVLGNEVDGISAEVLDRMDHWIEIPQFGTKHSLNVSVAAGMVLWDHYKSWPGSLNSDEF